VSHGDTLKVPPLDDSPRTTPQSRTLAQSQREHILRTLESTHWRIKGPRGAAALLGLNPSTLYTRMQKLGIPTRSRRDGIPT